MVKRVCVILLVAALAVTVSGCLGFVTRWLVTGPETLTGRWEGTLTYIASDCLNPEPPPITLVLVQVTDGSVTGSNALVNCSWPDRISVGAVLGTLNGATIHLLLTSETGDLPYELTGEVVGDTMSGTFIVPRDLAGKQGTWEVTRVE